MGILTIILSCIFIFLFPLGQLARIDFGNGVAVTPTDVAVGFAAIVIWIVLFLKKKNIPHIFRYLGGFLLIGLIGLVFQIFTISTREWLVSFLYLLRFLSYASMGLGVTVLSQKHKKMLWKVLLVAGGIVVGGGYLQYFLYPSLRNLIYAGWDPHLYRMFASFLDPNFAGPFFAVYFLIVLHEAFTQKTKMHRLIFFLASILTFFAVILSFSRGAYLVLGAGFLVYLFYKGYRKIAFSIPVGIILLGFLFAFFVPRGEGKNLLRTVSTDARLLSVESATTVFLKNPIVGVGFDSFRYAQYRYHLLTGSDWQQSHSGAGTNNSFLFVLATTGILGGAFYVYFWFVLMHLTWGKLKKKEPHGVLFISLWVTFLVSGLFENTLFYPSIMLWLWILVGFFIG